jgi:N-dimethylarginine dimethylaminohydrolase
MSRRFLMCPPTFFDVTYAINPWMALDVPVDRARAVEQWQALKRRYELLGHKVDVVDPVEGLPDMVFAANAGTVVDGKVLPTRFRHPERQGEEAPFRQWFDDHGYECVDDDPPVNEGEGDLLVAGDLLLAGTGFRTDPAAHSVAQEQLGLAAVQLQLVDPRYYHLDTALAVLDERTIAYLPEAFSPGSRRVLERLFPDAVLATADDAAALGLNMVSDGVNVVIPDGAPRLVDELASRGFLPHVVELGELKKAGGAAKCCTLELRD